MKSESVDFLEKAHRLLREASQTLDILLAEAAGRTAYLAGFHAAQAMIFERDDRTVKTHNGVHTEFARLVRDDRDFSPVLRSFLPRTYEMKSIADYGVGPGADVSLAEAEGAIEEAARFIALVEAKLAAPAP